MPPNPAPSLPTEDHDRTPPSPGLGGTLRQLRVAKGLTLQQLAALSDVSVGMLSQIERDRANPSLRVLCQVRDALGASMGELFSEARAPRADPDFVCRAGDRPWLDLGYMHKELLSHTKPGALQLMILVLPPGSTSGTLASPHEKGGLVLDGALVLTVGGEASFLGEGDSFLFDGTQPHVFRNPGAAEARVLWVMAPPRHDRQL